MFKFYIIFLLFPLFYLVRREATFETVIRYGNHTEIFYYLSNVSKFRLLNPTIIGITHWEQTEKENFQVEYTECLSQVPAIWNYARGFYRIRHDVDGSHNLLSEHLTCFYADFLCLSTNSSLRITKRSNGQVGYREEISYSCPWLLSEFCFNEVAFQRRSITNKLKEIFSNTHARTLDRVPETREKLKKY